MAKMALVTSTRKGLDISNPKKNLSQSYHELVSAIEVVDGVSAQQLREAEEPSTRKRKADKTFYDSPHPKRRSARLQNPGRMQDNTDDDEEPSFDLTRPPTINPPSINPHVVGEDTNKILQSISDGIVDINQDVQLLKEKNNKKCSICSTAVADVCSDCNVGSIVSNATSGAFLLIDEF